MFPPLLFGLAARSKLAGGSRPCPGRWGRLLAAAGLSLLSLAARAQAPQVGRPGFTADYYRGYFNDKLSFFGSHTAGIVGRPIEQLNFPQAETDNFNVSGVATYYTPGNPDEFSARFQAQLYIFTPGAYTFYLGSDDAASLWLDGQPQAVAVNHGDQSGFAETRGTCTLTTGLHTVQVFYGEHGGSQGLVLAYSGPDQPRQLVPNGAVYGQYAGAIQPTLCDWQLAPAADRQQVRMQWATASEANSVAYVVQRSADGVAFQDVVRLPAAGTSSALRQYEATDDHPLLGQSYYRLQQQRSDRPAVYSPIKSVRVEPVPYIVSVYPVPNDGNFYVRTTPNADGPARLELRDIAGHLVYRQDLELGDGQPKFVKPAQAVGIYRLYLSTSANQFSQKISLGY